jgi:hypothetical protein
MNKSELIADFINKIAVGDEGAKDAFSAYCSAKATAINSEGKILERFEQFKTALLEEIGNYEPNAVATSQAEEPLRMEGDKIFINNKLVGRVHVDMDDFDSGIDFISDDGSFSKEFHTAEELFAFISKKYLGESHGE